MYKLLSAVLLGSFLLVSPAFAQDFSDQADSSFDEDYSLYDRNQRDMDMNQYNFPASRRHRGYGY